MKKLLAAFLIALFSVPVWAEWELVFITNTSNLYIDPATIRKDGDIRRVWGISDNKQRGKTGDMSTRLRFEYSCKEERYRVMSFSTHSGPMAGGDTLTDLAGSDSWTDIAPGTGGETIMKVVCAK